MNPLDYLQLQLRLEGKEVINGKLLRQVEIVTDEEVPLVLLAQLADHKIVIYFDETLQPKLHSELTKQIYNISFPTINPLLDFLKAQNISIEVGYYKTYLFPPRFADSSITDVVCYSKHDPKIQTFGFDGFAEKIYAIEQDGKIVSACVSTRENKFCGEAWVYTDPEYRNRGFAKKVIGAWATELISTGKIPFYSHKIENIASANLANRLALQPVFEEIVISYVNV